LVHGQEEIHYEEEQTGALRCGSVYMANKISTCGKAFKTESLPGVVDGVPPVLWSQAARGGYRLESDLQSWARRDELFVTTANTSTSTGYERPYKKAKWGDER
jgi:hypothetical protein